MRNVTRVQATYTPTGIRRFDGLPFIEALPPLPETREDLLLQLSNYPNRPSGKDRTKSEIVRIMELSSVGDVVYPFPDYGESALELAKILRESYVARNPFTAIDVQRRRALASSADTFPFPTDWKSSAQGHIMVGITGSGKSTFSNAFLLRYPQLIQHTAFGDQPLVARQIVYVVLSVPHDATLKGLCIQFFTEVDRILGDTEYSKVAKSVRTIALMVQLMHHVASIVSLGLIIVDDVQNLRAAKGANAEYLLNLFSEIVERVGVSLFLMATPAIDKVLTHVVRNTRKSASSGCVALLPMAKKSDIWKAFSEAYWDYTYTHKKNRLTSDIRDAWWDASGGDPAFAALAFLLTQQNAIGRAEEVDEQGFLRTRATNMAILQPAIEALRTRKVSVLRRFDDLLFGKGYFDLMGKLKITETKGLWNPGEFDELFDTDDQAGDNQPSGTKRSGEDAGDLDFPVEDPLKRYEGSGIGKK
ncbi:ATP-binding protein [Paraburkholderia bannensis]|uniref:ATP-binding protein n=1 Tax=Paraburkholderia bannensis TaxID=765414 RepID=UPI002AB7902B|nr:ATP-binding protein [Paraburkholderia bannensis]